MLAFDEVFCLISTPKPKGNRCCFNKEEAHTITTTTTRSQASSVLQFVSPPLLSVPLVNKLVALYSIAITICARCSVPINPHLT